MKKITVLLLTVLPLIGFGQITNSTFDTDISGWNSNGTGTWNSTEGHNAAGSGQFVAVAGNNFRSSPNSQLSLAGDYTVNFWVKGAIGTTVKAQVFSWIAGNPSGPDLAMTGDWVEYTYTFVGCLTGVNGNIRVVAVTDGTYYIDDAYFTFNVPAGNYVLTTDANGGGTVTKTPDAPYYPSGNSVDVEAIPNTHWSFDSWSGDLTGSTNPTSVTMDADKNISANFTVDPSFDYDFLFNTDNDQEGWTTDPQLSITNHTGGQVTLTPTTDQFARFSLFDFPIPTSGYNKVTITLKNESTNDDELGLVIDNGSGSEVITMPMSSSDTGFQTYEFNETQFTTAWSGDLTTVRIRFADADNPSTGRSSGTGDLIIDDIIFSFDPSLSIGDLETSLFSIYPNPAKTTLHINSNTEVSKVQIFDITGKQVLETTKLNNDQVNVSNLKNGLYLLRIEDGNNSTSVKKLIIQ